jgi:ketosteroid isomerase-like protein
VTMSQANVEVVKRLFESYRRGDYEERLFDVYSFSDAQWVRNVSSDSDPTPSRRRD